MGFGLEQLTEFLAQTFKEARIITFDEENFEEFSEKMSMISTHECDIIVAPDVYSRAIMESDITLVGILALDLLLQMPSYLASERAYAMLSHAGFHTSRQEDARLIIQSYNPGHYVVKHFIANDYAEFFKEEINYREAGFNEPICQVNKILIKGPYKEAYKTADLIKRVLHELIRKNLIVLGPSYSTQEQAVQLIIKHQCAQINKIYQTIYEKYQNSNLLIIFQKYAQDLS
jgi:primosomal protein N' (replication factor Y)